MSDQAGRTMGLTPWMARACICAITPGSSLGECSVTIRIQSKPQQANSSTSNGLASVENMPTCCRRPRSCLKRLALRCTESSLQLKILSAMVLVAAVRGDGTEGQAHGPRQFLRHAQGLRGGGGDEGVEVQALGADCQADAGDRLAVGGQDRGRDGAQAVGVLAVCDGVAALAHQGEAFQQDI